MEPVTGEAVPALLVGGDKEEVGGHGRGSLAKELEEIRLLRSAISCKIPLNGSYHNKKKRVHSKEEEAMQYRRLGTTGLTVSEIGMGTWELGGREWGDVSEEDAVSLLRRAFEGGITLYDTADQYGGGRVERLLGRAFSGVGDRVVIATKVGYEIDSDGWISRGGKPGKFTATRSYIRAGAEGSLKRLGREVIDLYQFHRPPDPEQWDEAFETMEQLKAEGLIRFYGMCLGKPEEAIRATEQTGISSLMLTYNLLNQGMAERVLPAAQAKGVAVIVRQPLASGLLSGLLTADTVFPENDYRKTWPRERFLNDLRRVDRVRSIAGGIFSTLPQVALKFILAHPAVSAVVPGMMTPGQVDDGVATGDLPPLPADLVERLQGVDTESL
jgi:aryl-alcohol dehydrogenase-like predicted oxidoreductase